MAWPLSCDWNLTASEHIVARTGVPCQLKTTETMGNLVNLRKPRKPRLSSPGSRTFGILRNPWRKIKIRVAALIPLKSM